MENMCEYKEFCKCRDCDGYPEESELSYCLDARRQKRYQEESEND